MPSRLKKLVTVEGTLNEPSRPSLHSAVCTPCTRSRVTPPADAPRVGQPVVRDRTLLTGSALAISAQTVRVLTSLVSVPITISYLGKERYGLWMITISILTFVTLLDAGLAPTLKNRMTEAFAHEDTAHFRRYSSGALLLGASALTFGLLILPLLALLDWAAIYRVETALARTEALPLTLVVFGIALANFSLSFVDTVYAARMRIGVVYACNLVSTLAGFALLLAGIRWHLSLPLLALIMGAPPSVARLVLLMFLARQGDAVVHLNAASLLGLLRELAPTSFAFLGIQFSNVLLGVMPIFFVARLVGLAEVTTFNVAYRLATLPLVAVAAVVPVFWPSFTLAWVHGDRQWLAQRLKLVTLGTVLVLALYATTLWAVSPLVVRLWLADRIAIPRGILAAYGPWIVLQGAGYWLSTFLHSITDLRFQIVCYVSQAMLFAVLVVPLTSHLGLLGLVVAMGASLGAGAVAPLAWRARSRLATA